MPECNVFTAAMVGDKNYLILQMKMLGELPENLIILEATRKYHFAKPYPEFLAIYHALKHAGIEFDLIYGAAMWHILLQHQSNIVGDILYVHSGGLRGNASMLDRYKKAKNMSDLGGRNFRQTTHIRA
ncbi:MAG: hypothetical protein Q9M20_05735 [Mariprofundaceae bacterium]|nr:hypothetical protein [Mariprofundaceae bacterium]